ncbi:hypothetical protein NDI44_01785 [Trichocoleus sp. DQ-A3]|uniref:hypothetical protein n=1 Tax=Coleofasciculus sp. FACHB-125 TaxID=2692784 RepID=UPI00168A14F1|nr:hypothetical protein [Coleofasciculus sp. FACHB-125]MBD1901585.1 hypothetical protein [Coleofasciculus sp. FACHB-125]
MYGKFVFLFGHRVMKSALLQESPEGASKGNGSAQSLVGSLIKEVLTVVRVPG